MSAPTLSICVSMPRAVAQVAGVRMMMGKKCKHATGLHAGLLMVKKSKKRNPT